jgi:hypothetical protein
MRYIYCDKQAEEVEQGSKISRRLWLKKSATILGLTFMGNLNLEMLAAGGNDTITVGIITDVHYADRAVAGMRYYRDSIQKVRQAVEFFNERKPAFCIELGDFVDKGDTVELELSYLKTIEAEYAKFKGDRHYALGNHDVATFSKEQFLSNCGAKKNYYSFDSGAFHVVILDACYKKDESDYNAGNFNWVESYIPSSELEWLRSDLRSTARKTIVFLHQRLEDEKVDTGVKNAPLIRQIFEESGKVLAVFQGHEHAGGYKRINRIHYFTFKSLVDGAGIENNAYSLAHISENGSLHIEGFGKQEQLLGVYQQSKLLDTWGRLKGVSAI